MRRFVFIIMAALCTCTAAVLAQSVPAAIFTDPPADAAHPAKMTVLHIPSHGLLINGMVYQPAGAGLSSHAGHLPRLARETKRTSTSHRPSDARDGMQSPSTTAARGAARAFTASPRIWRTPTPSSPTCAILRLPPAWGLIRKRIAIAGHSMGGWVVAHTAAHDHALIGAILISAGDMGHLGEEPARAPGR